MSITAYGIKVGFRVTDAALLPELRRRLPLGSRPSATTSVDALYSVVAGGDQPGSGLRRFHLVYLGGAQLVRTLDGDEALGALEADLELRVAAHARQRVFVHAGVVGWNGRAILIPGRSGAGKTSLVAALVRAGASYYSDEFAPLDARGRVHPYPRPLAIREAGSPRGTKYPIESLGGRAGTKPLPVGLVAVTRFAPQATTRLRVLTPGQAILAMMDNTVSARTQPARALAALAQVASAAICLKGKRGEADETARTLLRRLDATRLPAESLPGRKEGHECTPAHATTV